MSQLFINQLTVIDFAYLDAERGLVGESWLVDVSLRGGLDHQGMLLDFGDVKKTVKTLIDNEFDHKLLVPALHPGLMQQRKGRTLHLTFDLINGTNIHHSSPEEAVQLLACEQVIPATVAPAIIDRLRPLLPDNVAAIDIALYPEPENGTYYHYTHGLKQHSGNCQRIAHGHRSRLVIERNGHRDIDLETAWARRWQDIYIGTRSDVIEHREGRMLFGYTSAQGRFLLQLPDHACYLIDDDSTVENITKHILQQLAQQLPNESLRVTAFEGINKGSVCETP